MSGVKIKQGDDLTYGDRLNSDNGFKVGDMLVEKPDDKGRVFEYFMGNWDLPNGATIWLNGETIGEVSEVTFRGGKTDQIGWGETKDVTIKAIPNTKVEGKSFTCLGLLNFKLPGICKTFPGLTALESKKFLSGNFPFHMKANPGGHAYNISVLDGGLAEIEGIEGQWGFSGLRFASGQTDVKCKLKLSNFYFHDTDTGEAVYLGGTQKVYPQLIVEMFNGIITRPAAEALQLQHLIGSSIHNITIACADTAWLNGFQPFQDTGIQYTIDSGVNVLRNIILDGFASNGLNPFSAQPTEPVNEALIESILFNDGRHSGHFLHSSNSFGVKWLLKKLFYRSFNNSYARTGKPAVDYICSKQHGTDVFSFQNCLFDKSKARFFEDPADGEIKQADQIPPINYVNSGFPEPMSNIMRYSQFWGAYHPISKGKQVPVDYSAGQILIDDHKFYKVRQSFQGSDKPLKDNEFCQLLTYDSNGVRSDMVGFNSASKQREDAPDDLRLKKDDFWRSMGMGYLEPKNIREEILEEVRTKTIEFLKTLK